MRRLLLLLFWLLFVTVTQAQKNDNSCATDAFLAETLRTNPEALQRFKSQNAQWQDFASRNVQINEMGKGNANTTQNVLPDITLSIAFHDIIATSASNYLLTPSSPTTNIDGYQYIINRLNNVFLGNNGIPQGINTHIQFCLTRTKNDGTSYTLQDSQSLNSESGVLQRNQISISNLLGANGSNFTTSPTKNINIYIVDDILGAEGFASLPISHGSTYDGIFIKRSNLINGANLTNTIKILAHEMGHYLGLYHTFGICDPSIIDTLIQPMTNYNPCSCDNNNCLFNGDMVCDTAPNQKQMGYFTPGNFPNTCHTDALFTVSDNSPNNPTTDIVDPKENFMDYGSIQNQYKFTYGQIQRMHFMVDASIGPRMSLLGNSFCDNTCDVLNNCNFQLQTNPSIQSSSVTPVFTIQNGSIPAVVCSFSSLSCLSNTQLPLTISWKLIRLVNPTVIVAQSTSNTFQIPTNLSPGNYQLEGTVVLNNTNCTRSKTFQFRVIPQAGPCNFNLPVNNTEAEWSNANFQRISIQNGWIQQTNGNYGTNTQVATDGQAGFNSNGFDVIPIGPGGVVPNDPLLGNITLPNSANLSKVIRVGVKQGGGGKAFFAKKTITINQNNCKFRIWFIGATTGDEINIASLPFIRTNNTNDAAFGFFSKYNFNSSVNGNSTALNTNIGYDAQTILPNYTLNNLVSYKQNSSAQDFIQNGLYKTMIGWKSIDLDYSEFVNLNSNTEITLTFFSHSNIALNSLQDAYAYYGVECLGGGVPQPYTFDIPNSTLPCSSPGTSSCINIDIPRPVYAQTISLLSSCSTYYNFMNINIYKIVNGVVSTTPTLFEFDGSQIKICLTAADAPYQDYKIICKTLHTTVEDTFRLYVGFYNNIPDCTEGDTIDPNNNPGFVNGAILLCGTDNLPTLHLTDSCLSSLPGVRYQWYAINDSQNQSNSYPINGATSNTLTLILVIIHQKNVCFIIVK